jgi:hypothetical protein
MAKNQDEKPKKESYGADSITVLEGLEPVRKRPGMYIGTTGPDGFHHLITEIFDNSRDEAMGGFCNDIEIALLPGERVRVVDNGRSIPVDVHKQTKVSALETIMTVLHAGGKFGGEGYKVSGGQLALGAGGGLEGESVHAANPAQPPLELEEDFQDALAQGVGPQGVQGGEIRQHGHPVVHLRVVFHGAGAQWIKIRVDGEVKVRESGEVANHLRFRQFRQFRRFLS